MSRKSKFHYAYDKDDVVRRWPASLKGKGVRVTDPDELEFAKAWITTWYVKPWPSKGRELRPEPELEKKRAELERAWHSRSFRGGARASKKSLKKELRLLGLLMLLMFGIQGCAPARGPESPTYLAGISLEALAAHLHDSGVLDEKTKARIDALLAVGRWAKEGMPRDSRLVCEPLKVVLAFEVELRHAGMVLGDDVKDVLDAGKEQCP